MRVVILGAGGLGSVFGAALALAGVEVTLIARPAHADAIRRNGLKLTGVRGEHLIREPLTAVSDPKDAEGEFDYLILGVKGKDTQAALESADCLKDRIGTALSFQNNVVKEDILGQWLGDPARVIGFSTIEAGNLVEPGHVHNGLTIPTSNYVGELNGTLSPRVEALADAFSRAGMGTRAVTNIRQVLWEKLTQICGAAAWSVSCLAGGKDLAYPDGLVVPEGAAHYVQVSRDALAVYKAMGYTPQNFYAPVSKLKELDAVDDVDAAVEMVMELGRGMQAQGYRGTTSMHEDVRRGKKTEVDWIIKPFIDQGRELGVPVPTLTAAYRIIKTLDRYLL
ncbi:MAG: 2-dehydropantoate 2-reductase [Immundisolibacter sp.]